MEATAARLLERIEAAGGRLLDFPLSGPSREQFSAGLRVTFEGKYAIYYTVSETEVTLLRVPHGARDAAAISERGGIG